MAEDKILTCKDCGEKFTFTAGEQEFYTQKGFQNEPGRCGPCRRARKRDRASASGVYYRETEPMRDAPLRAGYAGLERNQY
jgi:hypothetical protein